MPLAIVALMLIGLGALALYEKSKSSSDGQPAPGKPSGATPVTVINTPGAAPNVRQATAGELGAPKAPMEFNGTKPAKLDSTAELVKGLTSTLPGLATGVGGALTTAQRQSNENEIALLKLRPNDLANTKLGSATGGILQAPWGAEQQANTFGASSGMVTQDFAVGQQIGASEFATDQARIAQGLQPIYTTPNAETGGVELGGGAYVDSSGTYRE